MLPLDPSTNRVRMTEVASRVCLSDIRTRVRQRKATQSVEKVFSAHMRLMQRKRRDMAATSSFLEPIASRWTDGSWLNLLRPSSRLEGLTFGYLLRYRGRRDVLSKLGTVAYIYNDRVFTDACRVGGERGIVRLQVPASCAVSRHRILPAACCLFFRNLVGYYSRRAYKGKLSCDSLLCRSDPPCISPRLAHHCQDAPEAESQYRTRNERRENCRYFC